MSGERKPIERSGCLSTIACITGTWITLTLISGVASHSAAAWFAGGFLVCAVIAFWEAGASKKDHPHDN